MSGTDQTTDARDKIFAIQVESNGKIKSVYEVIDINIGSNGKGLSVIGQNNVVSFNVKGIDGEKSQLLCDEADIFATKNRFSIIHDGLEQTNNSIDYFIESLSIKIDGGQIHGIATWLDCDDVFNCLENLTGITYDRRILCEAQNKFKNAYVNFMARVELKINGKKYNLMVRNKNDGKSNRKPYVSFSKKFANATTYDENNLFGFGEVINELKKLGDYGSPNNKIQNSLHIAVDRWTSDVKPGKETSVLNSEQAMGRHITLKELEEINSKNPMKGLENLIIEEAIRWEKAV